MRKLPKKLQKFCLVQSGFFDVFCLRRLWDAAYQRDGSTVLKEGRRRDCRRAIIPRRLFRTKTRSVNPIGDCAQATSAKLLTQMRAIEAIGARHGIKVVFIVPPVYETDRHDSVVNQIFNRALTLVPDIANHRPPRHAQQPARTSRVGSTHHLCITASWSTNFGAAASSSEPGERSSVTKRTTLNCRR